MSKRLKLKKKEKKIYQDQVGTKKSSTFVIREMQVNTTRCHFTTKMAKNKMTYSTIYRVPRIFTRCRRECNLVQPVWDKAWQFFKMLTIYSAINPNIHKKTYKRIFKAAVFTIARTETTPKPLNRRMSFFKMLVNIYSRTTP